MKHYINKLLLIGLLIGTNLSCNHLKKHEIARIEYSSFGDFGSEESELILFETEGLTKARLEIKGDTVYIADVNQSGLDYFYSFLKELRSLKTQTSGYCTTDLSCTVYTRNETTKRTQINCQWTGFEYLKGILFKGQGVGKTFGYNEKNSDSSIVLDFSIRYGNYDFYFNVKQVSLWCDKMMNSKDGLKQMYKSIKQEVNHEPGSYLVNNHSWLMTLFTPRILNVNTKEEGKSLLIRLNDTLTADKTYFVITPQNDTIRIYDSRDRSF
jgi:hypothetical protein